MLYGDRIERLEQALTLWEDQCFSRRIESIRAKAYLDEVGYPVAGPLLYADHLRSHLFRSLNEEFDVEKFLGPPGIYRHDALGALFFIPPNLHSWVRCGRRIYHMTAEMQAMLAATSLHGTTWEDLKWPIQSFAITLDRPIIDDHERTYDCILVTKYTECPFGPDYESIVINILSTDLGKYEPIKKSDKSEIKKAAERNNMQSGVMKRFARWVFRNMEVESGISLALRCDKGDESIMYFLEGENIGIEKHHIGAAILAIRLVFGTILLLQTKEADRYFYSQGKKKSQKSKQERRLVTDEADLFLVSYEKFSTTKGRDLVRRLGESLSLRRLAYHKRDGYWRRPRGKGDNPNYPKTVWVKPTEINVDLKPDDGLPPSVREVFRK